MTHDELIAETATRLKRHPADVDVIVAGALDTIANRLADGEPVAVAGFGTFAVTRRAARTGRNPRTGDPIEYPASTSARFTPDARLRALMRGEPSPPRPRTSKIPETDHQEDPMAKKKDAKKAKAKKSDKPKRKDAGKKKAAKTAKAKKKSKKK